MKKEIHYVLTQPIPMVISTGSQFKNSFYFYFLDPSSCEIIVFNCDSLHARLHNHYEALSYKKKKHKRLQHKGNLIRKNLQ